MDALAGIELSPVKVFDQIVEVRAEKREHLRGRNNVTSCRSPTRGLHYGQSRSGLVTIKESEALWREEAMKKKLAALQESTTNLVNSSNIIWTARCSEDLLRNKIKGLESQLQVCLQKFPKDGVKKLVVQMEKQKLIYEEKALVALQKATQEKAEALSKAETLQGLLITAKAEGLRWQSLYEELKLSSGQLRENQHLSNEQLQQLHSQVELSRAREAELREEVVLLQQEKKELQYNIRLLEQDNQILRDEIEQLRDGDNGTQDFMMQDCLTSEEAEPQLVLRRDSQVEEQLRHTEEKLRLKERETSSGSWWRVLMFFLLLLAVAGVATLWLWHPPFREQVEDLCSDIETRIEDYLLEMASPQHSGCFRPI
ncbi:hypothetical protein INR49_022460 [Caranx melampygus]|nr:hypothetical protein INR49_022460 [Caranx melampygus]